jgi:cytosine/adenosine deaminase-related metal-dependent hydrolase
MDSVTVERMPMFCQVIQVLGVTWGLLASTALTVFAQVAGFPDRVLTNGTVITMVRPDVLAQAVAIKDGRIVGVGTNAAMQALAGSATKVTDLRGKALLPGFYAAHDHFPLGTLGSLQRGPQ